MPPRLLLALVLLAAAAAGWLVFGSAGDDAAGLRTGTQEVDGEGDAAALREVGGPKLTADGRPRGPGDGREGAEAATPAPTIGDPQPELVKTTLRGVVRGPGGRPIAGARVVLIDADGNRIELVTDASGWYTFRGTPGRYRVLIDGGRDGVAYIADAVLDGGSAGLPLQTQLQRPGGLRVRVQSKRGPLVGATVTLAPTVTESRLAGLPARETVTNADGVALFEDVVPGVYRAGATPDDGPTYRVQVTVHPDVTTEARILVLPTRPIVGTVRGGANGPALADASLRLLVRVPGVNEPAEQTWRTDYAGSYALQVPKGMPVRLEVRARDHAPTVLLQGRFPPSFLRAFLSPSPEPAKLDIHLQAGRAVHGVVRTSDGKAVPDLALALTGKDGFALGETMTGPDGRYRFEHVAPGTATFAVRTPGFALRSRTFVGVPHAEDVAFDLVVVPGFTLQGTVLDAAAQPVAGARVAAWTHDPWAPGGPSEQTAFSDARGWWRMEGLTGSAMHHLQASHGERLSAPVDVVPDAGGVRTLTLTLAGAATVRGTVRERATEQAIGGARVMLVPTFADGTTVVTHADAEGAFEARGLLPGTYRAIARAEGYVSAQQDVTPQRDAPGTVELTLGPGTVFEGVVVDKDELAIEGAEVFVEWRSRLVQPDHSGTPMAVTDAAGRFRLTGYPAGTYAVMARTPGSTRLVSETVKEGRTDIRLVLERPKETK